MSQRGVTPWPTTIWANPEFQQLTPLAQRLYFFLWTQPSVNSGGFLELHVTKWAKTSVHQTPEDVEAVLDELLARGWVMVDDASEDLWLCRWIREDAVNSPLIYIGALRAIRVSSSRTLRHAAYKEVCGLPRPTVTINPDKPEAAARLEARIDHEFAQLVEVVDKEGGKPFPNPFGTLSKPCVEVAGEGEVDRPSPTALCERCGRHPQIQRGLCGACLGRELP